MPTTKNAVALFAADVDGDAKADCVATVEHRDGVHVLVATATAERDLGVAAMAQAQASVKFYTPPADRVLVIVGARGADVTEVRVVRIATTGTVTLLTAGGKSIRVSDDPTNWPTIQLNEKEPTGGVGSLVPYTYVWTGQGYAKR